MALYNAIQKAVVGTGLALFLAGVGGAYHSSQEKRDANTTEARESSSRESGLYLIITLIGTVIGLTGAIPDQTGFIENYREHHNINKREE